jgi:undecaprenol kinase
MNSKKQKFKRTEQKHFSFGRIIASIKHSIEGIKYAYPQEQSLSLHGALSLIVIGLGFILSISFMQWAIIILSLLFVLSIELLNTAIEATVDLVTEDFHPLAKIAKDCGSASAFVATIASGLICGFIFIERLIQILG